MKADHIHMSCKTSLGLLLDVVSLHRRHQALLAMQLHVKVQRLLDGCFLADVRSPSVNNAPCETIRARLSALEAAAGVLELFRRKLEVLALEVPGVAAANLLAVRRSEGGQVRLAVIFTSDPGHGVGRTVGPPPSAGPQCCGPNSPDRLS